jgi:hypothetical protein
LKKASFINQLFYKLLEKQMYVIPLNLDDPFKRVFDAPNIAQAFIEDLLDVKITSIEKLEKDHKVTNAAALVRFDYRCKINGKYVIIEMQQGYKPDVVKRFYGYHCLSTALQLETIKETVVKDKKGNTHRTRNYVELEAVITIIWMAQDNFGLETDYIEYNLFPKGFGDFVRDPQLCELSKEDLELRRMSLIQDPESDRRKLSFLEENRLIFVFQSNIVKNKANTRYAKWFEFAEKTRNPNNQAADFDEFTHHSIFAQMIHRLSVGHADNQDLIKEMGEEAYYAAVKLGEQMQKEEEDDFRYWSIYDKVNEKYRDQYGAELNAERSKRFVILEENDTLKRLMDKQKREADEKAAQAVIVQQLLEKQKADAIEKAARAVAAKKLLEKEKAEAQKEKAEAQKEKAEAQKEKADAQKLLEKEKQERTIAKKLLQEEQKKVKKLEKEQKALAEKNQIKLMNHLLAIGLSIDVIAKSLEVSVQQIQHWQKLKK